jgi:GT2 family glycosyltransferase
MPDPHGRELAASVVIPTRNRPQGLQRCLEALRGQRTDRAFEVVVVDDGSEPPVEAEEFGWDALGVVRAGGHGPARARNAGLALARGPLVLFTDDDTEPVPTWVEAACSFLESNRTHVGVEGPVLTPPHDNLYEFTIENQSPGAYWTCNVAYRAEVLRGLGGFDESYPYPHCEDRDLAIRALTSGEIGFAPGMAVVHEPRPFSLRQAMRRGRYAGSELVLLRKFPEYFNVRSRLRLTLQPLINGMHFWRTVYAASSPPVSRSPRRLVRWALCATGYELAVAVSIVRWAGARRLRRRRVPAGRRS